MIETSLPPESNLQSSARARHRHVRRLTALAPSSISLTHRHSPNRTRVEQFIEQTYAHSYGATICHHYPTLMNVWDAQGNVAAAVGLRLAADGPLFLENYLPRPIESLLEEKTATPIARDRIVEIGNLASTGKGAFANLFVALAAHLRAHGFDYATVTATAPLRRSFLLFGFDFVELGRANRDALPGMSETWGSYYDCDPKVVAGPIFPAHAQLEALLPARGARPASRPGAASMSEVLQ